MLSPRWKKIWRDAQATRGRLAMMVIAMAVSIFGVGAVLSSYTILMREISRNYLGTNPASAYIELDRVDSSLVQAVKQRPDIQEAEATSWVAAKIQVRPQEWLQLLLFVIPDFHATRIATFQPAVGSWPPEEGTLLLEREALKLIGGKVGNTFTVQSPNGPPRAATISGTVHDPGLAPAWQEKMVYGYVTPSTLSWLGEDGTLRILKVVVKGQPRNPVAIETTVGALVGWLKQQGRSVGEIRIPPPGQHPHQSQMNSVLTVLLIFSVMALLLSAILIAALINGLLAQQIRQIGIMKAIGARSGQISRLYLVLIGFMGLLATAFGIPLGVAAGRGLAGVISGLLNFTIYSQGIPASVYVVLLLMGVLVPSLAALLPITSSTRTTVRVILNDYGTSRVTFGSGGLARWLSRVRGMDNTLILALRNTLRRSGRLALTLALLGAAGAMFMAGMNVRAGWMRFLEEGIANRQYDLEVRLNGAYSKEEVFSAIYGVPTVQAVESWDMEPMAVYRPDGLDIVRTYPDGSHGSLFLRSTPPQSTMLKSPVLSGRWLEADDSDGIAMNQLAAAFYPGVKVGDSIRLAVNGRIDVFKVVGLVRQVMTPAMAYVIPSRYAQTTALPLQSTNAVRVLMKEHGAAAVNTATAEVGRALAAKRIGVKAFIPRTLLEGASDAHVYIFIYSLIAIAVIMAVVGALGLASSMGTSVIERTREFGVMRAIGAKSRVIMRNILSEGVFTGLLSYGIAVLLSLLPSLVVGNLIGTMFSRVPLALIVSGRALAIWLLVVVLGSAVASAFPGWQASRLTVRETLSYI